MLETAAIIIVLGLYINQLDRNVEIKSSAGSSPSSLVHVKHSQDWVIRGYTHIEFVARTRTGNPFRCAVTDLRLLKSLSCHRTAHQLTKIILVGPQSCYIIRLMSVYRRAQGKSITAYTRALYGGGGRKVKATLLPLAHYQMTHSNKRKFDCQLITYPVYTRRIFKSKKILKLNNAVSYEL